MNDLEEVYRDAVTTRLMRRMGHALEHDLKSPVQGIYWALELALKSVSAPGVDEKTRAQVEKAVTMARKELVRLERTSRAFLNDSGISESEGQTRIDLSELARETVRHFVTDAAIRNVRSRTGQRDGGEATRRMNPTPPASHFPRRSYRQASRTAVHRYA